VAAASVGSWRCESDPSRSPPFRIAGSVSPP
jgi:hypothetical protein